MGVERVHGRLGPAADPGERPEAHDRADDLMAIAEDVRPDVHRVADAPLRRIAAAVEQRLRLVDADAGFRLGGVWRGHSLRQLSANAFR